MFIAVVCMLAYEIGAFATARWLYRTIIWNCEAGMHGSRPCSQSKHASISKSFFAGQVWVLIFAGLAVVLLGRRFGKGIAWLITTPSLSFHPHHASTEELTAHVEARLETVNRELAVLQEKTVVGTVYNDTREQERAGNNERRYDERAGEGY